MSNITQGKHVQAQEWQGAGDGILNKPIEGNCLTATDVLLDGCMHKKNNVFFFFPSDKLCQAFNDVERVKL